MKKILKQKQFDIQLSGSGVTDELFDYVTCNVMVNGCESVRYNSQTIEYPMGAYFCAKEDMREFLKYIKENYTVNKIERANKNRLVKMYLENGKIIQAELIANELETIPI